MVNTMIVEDNKADRDILANLLKEHCQHINVIAIVETVREAIQQLKNLKPDLVLLKIELSGEDGFSLLKQLEKFDFEVIFTTNTRKHALRGFEFSAVDYLLKPIKASSLVNAIRKFEKRNCMLVGRRMLESLLNNIKNGWNHARDKIVLPLSTGHQFVTIGEIVRCEAEEHYTMFYLVNGEKILVSRIMKEYEDILKDHGFYRIHHAHLINMNHIHKFSKNGGAIVEMIDKTVIPIAKRKRDDFLEALQKNIGT